MHDKWLVKLNTIDMLDGNRGVDDDDDDDDLFHKPTTVCIGG